MMWPTLRNRRPVEPSKDLEPMRMAARASLAVSGLKWEKTSSVIGILVVVEMRLMSVEMGKNRW